MLAPRRVPPCLTCSVAVLKIFMKETGPEATPPVVPTLLFLGLSREKENPVPPPDLWIMAALRRAPKMPSMRVFHRQHEAGRQLAQAPAGVHQRGGIGQKDELGS